MNFLLFLLHLPDKSAFLKRSEIFFHKKTKSGHKVLTGPVKYISVDLKEAFTDIY